MIKVDRLTKFYGSHRAVHQLSFEVPRGEVLGFLGPNGAGKSTTLRILTGYLAPSSGSVHIDGLDVVQSSQEARSRVGYMPEGVPLYREMRVHEYLKFRAALKGMQRRDIASAVDQALHHATVVDARNRIIGQLSKGYRQRVGLADALIADPPILVLDEPTAGLDPNQVRQFRELVRGVAGDKTVMLSTHILSEVEALCDRVIVIHKGEKVGEETGGTQEKLEALFAQLTSEEPAS